ncbi:MAG TPA: WG repeat-containing protein [Cyclobacteriaceae bacterium]|nr:WG repeat-containing protein [Cyclobacteriaceae bacterium]
MKVFVLFFALIAYSYASAEYLVFYENGKAGVRDDSGKVIIPASFDALGWTDGSFSVINQVTGFRQKGKWGLINLKKEFVTKAEFESVTSTGGDRVVASRQINPYTVKYGCVDLTGKITVPFIYDGISIQGLRAIVFVKNGAKYEHGLIDLDDKTILPVKYRDIRPIGSLRFAIQNFDRRTALFSEQGTQLTEFVIDSISAFKGNYAVIYQNFKQGLIDREGTIPVQPLYREIKTTANGIEGRLSDAWLLLDTENKSVGTVIADELVANGEHYIATLAGKYGTVKENFNQSIPLKYDRLAPFENNLTVARKGKKYGLISHSDKEIFPFEFDSLVLEGNFVRAMKKNQGWAEWSVYDTFNVKKTERPYEELHAFNGQFFPVKNHGYWGAVDRYGKELLTCVYDSLIGFNYDVANVKFKGLYGLVGFDEKWRVYPQKNKLTIIDSEHYLEKQDTILFLKNTAGQVIYFSNNSLEIKNNFLEENCADGTVRHVTLDGISSVVVAPPKVDNTEEVFEESEGMRGIRRDGQYGFVDSKGRLRIANRYEKIGRFREGLAPVMIVGKWGYVSKHDHIVVNPSFEQVGEFNNGIAIVKRNGKAGVIDKEGQTILAMRYDSITRVSGLLVIHEQNQTGLADHNGRVLIEPRFDQLQLLPNNLVIVRNDEKWGVLTTDGMPVVPLIYNHVKYNPATNQFLARKKSDWKVLLKN